MWMSPDELSALMLEGLRVFRPTRACTTSPRTAAFDRPVRDDTAYTLGIARIGLNGARDGLIGPSYFANGVGDVFLRVTLGHPCFASLRARTLR